MTDQRVRFRDVKPYEIVDSLDELQGPISGVITPPVDVYWSGLRRDFDVADDRQRRRLYQATLSHGRHEHLTAFLNRDYLLRDWVHLSLDERIVELWTERFPEFKLGSRN